jgi:hypothetical protein
MRRVLDLDPFAAAARAVATVAPLGDDALQTHDARLPEYDCAVDVLDVLAHSDADSGIGQELHQDPAPARPGLVAQVATIKLQQVERIQEGIGRALRLKQARMRSKSDLPSDPQITPSPSSAIERTGSACMASTMAGSCLLQS